jgi:hypothetical protein
MAEDIESKVLESRSALPNKNGSTHISSAGGGYPLESDKSAILDSHCTGNLAERFVKGGKIRGSEAC